MKKRILFGVVALLVGVAGFFFFSRGDKQQPAAPRMSVAEMIIDAQARKRDTDGPVLLRPELAEIIKDDPDQVIVHFLLQRARQWPGILPVDEKRILEQVQGNSGAALQELERSVFDGVTRRMAKEGTDPTREDRLLWNDNNPATIWLFVELPLAERLGKKREFITEFLQRDKGRDSWMSALPEGKYYQAWSARGVWPFPGEVAPIYRYKQPRRS